MVNTPEMMAETIDQPPLTGKKMKGPGTEVACSKSHESNAAPSETYK